MAASKKSGRSARGTRSVGREMPPAALTIPSTQAQNEFGRILDQATAGQDIAITRHNVTRAVLVSAARYRQLTGGGEEPALTSLDARFDELYALMQTAKVREGTARAVEATPGEMGRAAVAAAKRSPRRRRSA